MANKSLSYFMRKPTNAVITVPGPASFKDEDGKVIQFQVRELTQTRIKQLYDAYTRRSIATDKKGNTLISNGEVVWKTEKDNDRALRHVVVEALAYPDLKDPELMEFYECDDITDMPLAVFSKPGEFAYVTDIVMKAIGLREDAETDEEELNAAKN